MNLTDRQQRRYAMGMLLELGEKTPTQRLLEMIEAFLKEKGISASTFGIYVVRDGKFVSDLRNGGKIGLDRAAIVLDAFDNWDAYKSRYLTEYNEKLAAKKAKG